MSKRDEAIVHLRDALDLLCADTSGKSPVAHFLDVTLPGCELKVGGPHHGTGKFAYYLTLPRGVAPPEGARGWMCNPSNGRWWYDGIFATREEATREGLIALLGLSGRVTA